MQLQIETINSWGSSSDDYIANYEIFLKTNKDLAFLYQRMILRNLEMSDPELLVKDSIFTTKFVSNEKTSLLNMVSTFNEGEGMVRLKFAVSDPHNLFSAALFQEGGIKSSGAFALKNTMKHFIDKGIKMFVSTIISPQVKRELSEIGFIESNLPCNS